MMKIGFGRVDVTPPLGAILTGAWQPRTSDGIRDPIELNAVVFSQGEDTAVVITADFQAMQERFATELRNLIGKELGIPAQNVLMQSLHQHTSISGGSGTMPEFIPVLKRKYCDVVRLALNDMAEATVSAGERETAEPVAFVRRFRMKDGSVMTNPGPLNPEIDHPLGEADNTVRLLRFHREGKDDIAMVGFQTHPDTLGGSWFSADWPGFVRRTVEERMDGVRCILINGCEGDTNHIDVKIPRIQKSRQDERYEFTRRMGQIIAEAAMAVWDQTEPVAAGPISAACQMHNIRSNTVGIEHLEECKEIYKLIWEGKKLPMPLTMAQKGAIRRIARMENITLFQKVPVSMIAVGGFALVGYGGEPFTEYATVLREAFPSMKILTVCQCNGSQGYLPSAAAFEEGGYEAKTTNFTPVVPTILQGAAKEMIRAHLEKQS